VKKTTTCARIITLTQQLNYTVQRFSASLDI